MKAPKALDIGKAVAADRGLNAPAIEAAYGRVEDAFSRALPRLLDFTRVPTSVDLSAVREYAVLLHDRYPALRGSPTQKYGTHGGNVMMVPSPANWGRTDKASRELAHLATITDREQLKGIRLQALPALAQLLPPVTLVARIGPLLLGDTSIHAITLHRTGKPKRSYTVMPLSSNALIVFGDQAPSNEEVHQLARVVTMKIATESTIVIDTEEAPVVNSFVRQMWEHQLQPAGEGVPQSVDVYDRLQDIPD
nr:hypothetical protein [Microbacterium sp. W4I20]